jgi:hypothetical protein
MLSSCKVLAGDVRLLGDNKIWMPTDFESGKCWGAFATLQAAIVRIVGESKTPVFGVCSPENSTRTQLISIFVEYAKKNPRFLNEDFFTVAIRALREAFPCPAPQ